MDKKRIDIDELVRQRFAGQEAPMPPGAWNKMSALLDEERPQPVVAYRGRRFLGLFLLLGALAGSAGYAVWQSGAAIEASPMAALGSQPNGLIASNTGLATTPSLSATTAAGNGAANVESTTPSNGAVPGGQSLSGTKTVSGQKMATPLIATPTRSAKTLVSPLENALAGGTNREKRTETSAPNSPLPVTENAVAIATPTVAAPPKPTLPTVATLPAAAHRRVTAASALAGILALNSRETGKLLIGESTLQELQNLSQYTFSTEGLSVRKARRAQRMWDKRSAIKTSNPVLTAAAPPAAILPPLAAAGSKQSAATQSALLVPLANYKVGSRKTKASDVITPQEQLSNVVANIKQTAAQTKFYAGILGGISSSLTGAGSLQGFQFGLMGMMALSERFALVTELRYLRRLNGSSNLRDDYYKTTRFSESSFVQNGETYNVYRYDLDSSMSFYKFEGINTFQVPIYARVSFNRFSVLGGLNLAYHMRTDVEQGGDRIATISRYDTLLASATPRVPLSREAAIRVDDFGSRFGVGYVVGATYNLSPAVSLDMRLSQQLWDSRRRLSEGARTVSKTYFQLPTLQFSVGYRFQQKAAQPRRQ